MHCAMPAGSLSPMLLTQLYSVAKGAILSLVHSWLSEWDWWDIEGVILAVRMGLVGH